MRDERRAPLKTPAWEAMETRAHPGLLLGKKSASRGLWVRDRRFLVPVSFTLTGKMADKFLRYSTF